MWRKKIPTQPSALARKVAKLSSGDLYSWADKYLSDLYMAAKNRDSAADLALITGCLNAIYTEMDRRK